MLMRLLSEKVSEVADIGRAFGWLTSGISFSVIEEKPDIDRATSDRLRVSCFQSHGKPAVPRRGARIERAGRACAADLVLKQAGQRPRSGPLAIAAEADVVAVASHGAAELQIPAQDERFDHAARDPFLDVTEIGLDMARADEVGREDIEQERGSGRRYLVVDHSFAADAGVGLGEAQGGIEMERKAVSDWPGQTRGRR